MNLKGVKVTIKPLRSSNKDAVIDTLIYISRYFGGNF